MALGAAIYRLEAFINIEAIGSEGIRIPTVSKPPVISYGTMSLFFKIIVKGPGQKCSANRYTILRPGFITAKQLKQVTKIIQYDKAVLNRNKKLTVVAKAPGMKYKHYAPKADLTIYEGSSKAVIDAINREAKQQELQKRKVGILATDETISEYLYGIVKSVGTRENEITITSSLFERLREFDTIGVEVIYAESFDSMKHGQAVMNRLLKAAGYQISY